MFIFINHKCKFKNSNMQLSFSLSPANLTGHAERVGMENFELLKVLGTGGRCLNKV